MSDYLPEVVVLEILKRLPVKSLLRFRSVSWTWNSLICGPSFISTHLQSSLSNNTPFFLIHYGETGKDNYSFHYDNDGFDELKQLQLPVFDCSSRTAVLDSCNGLICLILFHCEILNFVIWNPSIQKYIFLPQLSISEDAELKFGFGFDSRTNDYKLLIVGVEEKDGSWIQPYLFSLNENCWKRVTSIPPNYTFGVVTGDIDIKVPFVNGAVHWLGYQTRNNGGFSNVILGFDFSAEEFMVINLPESLIGLWPPCLTIMKYGESSIAVCKSGELRELWVKKEYGVVESWTKVLALTRHIQSKSIPYVLGFRKNGEVLLEVDRGKMASLDFNCLKMEPHVVEGVEVATTLITIEGSYIESLVLLDVHSGSLVRTGKYIHLLFH
ncbi:hypothetical protein GQ457_02G032530 [Hibiscus cannabinus]